MGITNDLERLAELHRSGAISDAEFASAKARALGETPQACAPQLFHPARLGGKYGIRGNNVGTKSMRLNSTLWCRLALLGTNLLHTHQ